MGRYTGDAAHVDADRRENKVGANAASQSLVERSALRLRARLDYNRNAPPFDVLRNGV